MNSMYGQYGAYGAEDSWYKKYNPGYQAYKWATAPTLPGEPPEGYYDESGPSMPANIATAEERRMAKADKRKVRHGMPPNDESQPKPWLKTNWPYLVAGAAVITAGVAVAVWKPGRRKNPKGGFIRGALGFMLSAMGAALVAFPDPTPGFGPSSLVGWPLLVGGLAVWDIKVLPGQGEK